MHVGIITYQTGHLKTWQILRKMRLKGFRVTLFAFPFKLRAAAKPDQPLRFADRPFQLIDYDVPAFCAQHGINYVPVSGWSDAEARLLDTPGPAGLPPDIYLHCIAKIIPPAFLAGRTILNCHPGLLPQNRGVDAFKWSIVKRWPIGITLHAIDEAIDRGTILYRVRVPVLHNDTMESLCRRAYDFEVDLLGNFEHHLSNLARSWHVGEDHPCSHSLIPLDDDRNLEATFSTCREEFVRLSSDLDAQPHEADRLYSPKN